MWLRVVRVAIHLKPCARCLCTICANTMLCCTACSSAGTCSWQNECASYTAVVAGVSQSQAAIRAACLGPAVRAVTTVIKHSSDNITFPFMKPLQGRPRAGAAEARSATDARTRLWSSVSVKFFVLSCRINKTVLQVCHCILFCAARLGLLVYP